jgi:phage-related protein (TIGR01555 family)
VTTASSEITDNSSLAEYRSDEESARIDGALVNGLTGMGVLGRDKSQHTRPSFSFILSHPELEALYSVGLPRRYVDAIADAVLKHRPTITLGGDKSSDEVDQIKDFEAYLKQVSFYRAYAEAIRLQRLYGGAAIVMLIDDGVEDPSEPVNFSRIRGIRGLCPLSRHEIFPMDMSVMDQSKPNAYRITTNQKLDPEQTSNTTNITIHHTRVIRFDGLYLPWRLRQQQNGWGQAPLQVVWEAWKTYESAIRGLESSITDSSVFWHKIPGLMNMVKAGNTAAIMKRMEINNLARSTYGGMVLDKDEEIGFSERALGNMAQATAPFAEYMQATTGWPASILMGTSPGGLGKEGRFEERVWASLVEDWQSVYCQEPVTDLFTMLMLAKESPMRGKVPDSWEVHFPSVFTETDTEKTALRAAQAGVDQIYATIGVLKPVEIRNNRFGSTQYSIETVLDKNVSAQLEMQQDTEFENNMNQLQAQSFQAQGLGPDGEPIPPEPDPNAAPADQGGILPPEDQGSGEDPGQSQPESQASQPQEPAKGKKKSAPKTDSYEALDLHINVLRHIDGMSMGRRVSDDYRADAAGGPDLSRLVLIGPSRSRRYAAFRTTIKVDEAILPGPLVTGFASLRAARKGLTAFLPEQTVFTMTPAPEDEK